MTDKYLKEHAHSRDTLTLKTLMMFFSGYMIAQITTKAIAEYRNMRLKSVKLLQFIRNWLYLEECSMLLSRNGNGVRIIR